MLAIYNENQSLGKFFDFYVNAVIFNCLHFEQS